MMPFLQLFTTLSRSQVPENLGQVLAQTLSTTMRNKPLERICVHISTDQLIFSGIITLNLGVCSIDLQF